MATIRKQSVKLGIFVLGVTAILVVALFLVGALHFWRRVDTYHVVTSEGVAGLDLQSDVTLRGVTVGKVVAIELDHRDFANVRIDLEIEPGIAIPAGSKAYFERVGLTGERFIDITGGSLAEGRLEPGSVIPRGETTLDLLETRAERVSAELSTLIADLSTTVRDIEVLVDAVDPKWITSLVEAVEPKRVAAIVTNTERASKGLRRAVGEGREHIGQITEDVDAVAGKASTALEHADVAMNKLAGTVGDADDVVHANADDIRIAIENLRHASQDAKELFEMLKKNPSLLLHSKRAKRRRSR